MEKLETQTSFSTALYGIKDQTTSLYHYHAFSLELMMQFLQL